MSAGSQNYAYYPVPQLDRVLTYWNLMVRRFWFSLLHRGLTLCLQGIRLCWILADICTSFVSRARSTSLRCLSQTDNQANLYGGSRTGVSTDAAVKHYISAGATPRKIVMGNTFFFPPRKDPHIKFHRDTALWACI